MVIHVLFALVYCCQSFTTFVPLVHRQTTASKGVHYCPSPCCTQRSRLFLSSNSNNDPSPKRKQRRRRKDAVLPKAAKVETPKAQEKTPPLELKPRQDGPVEMKIQDVRQAVSGNVVVDDSVVQEVEEEEETMRRMNTSTTTWTTTAMRLRYLPKD